MTTLMVAEEHIRNVMQGWRPAWMEDAPCPGIGQPPRVLRLVVERIEDKDVLECGHVLKVDAVFEGATAPPLTSYRRNCRLCGDRSYLVDIWFPPKGGPSEQYAREAKVFCFSCPVKEQCLDYAIDERIHTGVWGGTTLRGRQMIVPH